MLFVAACSRAPTIRKETNFSPDFLAANVMTESQDVLDGSGANYWISQDGLKGQEAFFILDLGCVKDIDLLRLINTHNAGSMDRSTKQFR